MFQAPGREPHDRWGLFVESEFGDRYPSRAGLLERWRAANGEAAFGRALERAIDVLP